MGVKKGCVFGSNQNIAFSQQIERSAASHTIYCRNHWFPQIVCFWAEQPSWIIKVKGSRSKPGNPIIIVITHSACATLAVINLFCAVNARAKSSITSGSEHNAPNLILVSHASPQLVQFMHHQSIERVQNLGTVERNRGNTLFAEFYGDGLMI